MFLSAVATAHIAFPPLRQSRGEVVAVAASFGQARIIFDNVIAFMRAADGGIDEAVYRLQDSQNAAAITHRRSGARFRCLGNVPSKAHGLSSHLILADEGAQWDQNKSQKMFAALKTSLGKLEGSRFIALGTKPAEDDEHWFSRMLAGEADVSVSYSWSGPDDGAWDDPATWAKINPSLSHMPTLARQIAIEAEEVKRNPTLLPQFLAFRLNSGDSEVQRAELVSVADWKRLEGEAVGIERGAGSCVWGVDIGGNRSMTACSAWYPATGRLEGLGGFPNVPDLGERGILDGVSTLYEVMRRRGDLILSGERALDYNAFFAECLDRFGPPDLVIADRYKQPELEDALMNAGIQCDLLWRGNGLA